MHSFQDIHHTTDLEEVTISPSQHALTMLTHQESRDSGTWSDNGTPSSTHSQPLFPSNVESDSGNSTPPLSTIQEESSQPTLLNHPAIGEAIHSTESDAYKHACIQQPARQWPWNPADLPDTGPAPVIIDSGGSAPASGNSSQTPNGMLASASASPTFISGSPHYVLQVENVRLGDLQTKRLAPSQEDASAHTNPDNSENPKPKLSLDMPTGAKPTHFILKDISANQPVNASDYEESITPEFQGIESSHSDHYSDSRTSVDSYAPCDRASESFQREEVVGSAHDIHSSGMTSGSHGTTSDVADYGTLLNQEILYANSGGSYAGGVVTEAGFGPVPAGPAHSIIDSSGMTSAENDTNIDSLSAERPGESQYIPPYFRAGNTASGDAALVEISAPADNVLASVNSHTSEDGGSSSQDESIDPYTRQSVNIPITENSGSEPIQPQPSLDPNSGQVISIELPPIMFVPQEVQVMRVGTGPSPVPHGQGIEMKCFQADDMRSEESHTQL